jgi:4-hydroxyphenylacetate 3-monooxygenase
LAPIECKSARRQWACSDATTPIHERAEVCVHVERETDGGIYVSGAKVIATGSALTHATFVAHNGLIPVQDPTYACIFMIPMSCARSTAPAPSRRTA